MRSQSVRVCLSRTALGLAAVLIARQQIDGEMVPSPQSIMPEGLLRGYTDQQLRDLFGYLRMTQPLID